MAILGLVTEAYGGRGGIAAVTRDMAAACNACERVGFVRLLPRLAPDPAEGLPAKTSQLNARSGRFGYSLNALVESYRTSADIIYCNHLFMAPLAAMVAYIARARLVVHLHGIEIWNEPSMIQKWALEKADLMLCVSRDTRARVLDYCDINPERAVVLNNTFSEVFKPGDRVSARSHFGLGDETVLLTVGRISTQERYKGHDRVIEALARLTQNNSNILYLIAGEGDDQPRLVALAEAEGVSQNVRFLGHVPFDDLPNLYRAADLFVMPSTGEGFGVAFLEAMACGTPALGLAFGGAGDALADSELGYLVDARHFEEALSACLKADATDREALARSIRARYGRISYRLRLGTLTDAWQKAVIANHH